MERRMLTDNENWANLPFNAAPTGEHMAWVPPRDLVAKFPPVMPKRVAGAGFHMAYQLEAKADGELGCEVSHGGEPIVLVTGSQTLWMPYSAYLRWCDEMLEMLDLLPS
jgi:hypothetical protein